MRKPSGRSTMSKRDIVFIGCRYSSTGGRLLKNVKLCVPTNSAAPSLHTMERSQHLLIPKQHASPEIERLFT